MDIQIVAFEKSLFLFILILNVRGSAECISKDVFFLYFNTKCVVIIIKVCSQKIRNSGTAAVTNGPNLYCTFKLIGIFLNVLFSKLKNNIASGCKTLVNTFSSNGKVACPFLLIACASGNDGKKCVCVLAFSDNLISHTNTHCLLTGLLRIIFIHIKACEIPLSEQITQIAALNVISGICILAADRSGCKDHRHCCKMLVVIKR